MSNELVLEKLKTLPARPGVYLYRDAKAAILYVGKAINLRNRVRSYFHASHDSLKTLRLVSEIADLEWIITETELEALVLEANLIKKHRPRFNIRLKDDKRYPYIKIEWQNDFPKVLTVRKIEQDGARYYGPYTNAGAVYATLDTLRRIFPYLTCDREITGKDRRACLYYDIKLCNAPCIGAVNKEEYRATLDRLCAFLEGKTDRVVADIEHKMEAASEAMQFERAAEYRDQLHSIRHIVERQKVVSTTGKDQDVVAFARDEQRGDACVQVFFIRQGKLIGREYFVLEGAEGEDTREIMSSFLKQFYEEAATVPPEILMQVEIEEAQIIEQWLRQKRGAHVLLDVPREGPPAELVSMAAENAAETLSALQAQWLADEHKNEQALKELADGVGLEAPPGRIECFDISNTQGTHAVASMVVFVKGVPRKSHYRKFNIKTVQGPDDFASMREALTRRLRRYFDAKAADGMAVAGMAVQLPSQQLPSRQRHLPGQKKDESFAVLPDLLIVDGGKGQLGVAVEVLKEFDLFGQVPVCGLAKQQEEIFLPGRPDSILLPRRSQGLFLIQRIRDEAHRFAITAHRSLRAKQGIASQLDAIPGVGPARRRALLKHFGSLDAIRAASADDIASVPGIPREVADAIKSQL
ncbi:MAG TPA: excinuclease ABC subunit UvrC [Anaerolineae bacterium]|nr:excinuclease ABC subunit UvrC [Anaerolineae bacterium]